MTFSFYQILCTKPKIKLRKELPRIHWTYSNIDQYSFKDGYMFERITFSFPFRSWHVLNVFNLLNCFFNHFAFLMHDFFTSSPITYYSGTRFTDVSFLPLNISSDWRASTHFFLDIVYLKRGREREKIFDKFLIHRNF